MLRSEKDKMLAGELYLASDPELVSALLRAQALLAQFNTTAADAEQGRRQILGQLLAHVGESTVIKPVFRCDYGFNISVGDRTFINYDCIFLDCNLISIGQDVQIGPGVHIYTATHPVEAQARRSGHEYALPVGIGDAVWLGGGSIICPGVTIAENTVVGAGSVVTRDLPANVVAAGNPCRVLRHV
jgi:maltose O-acetyltransferase